MKQAIYETILSQSEKNIIGNQLDLQVVGAF